MTPPLSTEDKLKIEEVYIECERISKETGVLHHVDHIKPLSKGGEHEWMNLQIITAEENLSKGDKYRPEDQALYAQRLAQFFKDS